MFIAASILVCVLAEASSYPTPRVVGGQNATDGEFPFAVQLWEYNSSYFYCSGSIIGKRWILTAGHCVDEDANAVRYGTIKFGKKEFDPNYDAKIIKQYRHPEFEDWLEVLSPTSIKWHFANDIGLFELEEDLPYGPNVQPIALPEQDAVVPFNATATLIGWGYVNANHDFPEVLQKIDQTIFDNTYCDSRFTDNDPYNGTQMLCAGDIQDRTGECNGDSGGSIVVDNVQIGISSWSNKPCISGPGVFTRISVYRDWIRNVSGI
ncbi:trypsin-6-like [Cylas formicarius]|uniref:trypsin-6-like n=1 Tax=Cylas formicarius TaxID=197179 RepID=UPI00295890E1|nr:trypsin-6-like [Cylas formicarius]